MSEAEDPERLRSGREVSLDDVRALMGASTPHFALQLRARIRALIRGLPADHPARIEGEREIARLDQIAFDGEVRGHPAEEGLTPLRSLDPHEAEEPISDLKPLGARLWRPRGRQSHP